MKQYNWVIISAMFVPPLGKAIADDFSVHGFISQGITQSAGLEYITDNDKVTTELSELGLNMRYEANKRVALVAQGVYLDGGNRFEQGGRLDYLFLNLTMPEIGSL